ncbi:hypothetical protein [Micromonospora viridifaciens]|uniref:hypothetical protein n=1 Tax=Micromonospora viridifaciens TaxID=1881 RepID=UPI0012FE61BB|nr:hypothetical protein [Micromonospora viridifaciens]
MATFDVEVISDPIGLMPNKGFDFDNPLVAASPEYDTQIVKPALLFADRVHLVSSRSTIHHYIGVSAQRITSAPLWQLYEFLTLSTGRHLKHQRILGIDAKDLADPAEAHAMLDALIKVDNSREGRGLWNELILPFWSKHRDKIEVVVDACLRKAHERHDMLIASEIRQAIDRGVLSIQGWGSDVSPDDQENVFIEDFLAECLNGVIERLRSPSRVALLDPGVAGATGDVGTASSSRRPSFIANEMLSRLVGLHDLPVVEVLDLREDLKDYLPHFRSEMIRLAEEIAQSEIEEEIPAILDRRWHRDILPALEEIRREVAAARYPRRLLDAVTSDPVAITSSVGALTVAAGGLAFGLNALAPAIFAAAPAFLRAKADQSQRIEKARTNKLFFLYAVQSSISDR